MSMPDFKQEEPIDQDELDRYLFAYSELVRINNKYFESSQALDEKYFKLFSSLSIILSVLGLSDAFNLINISAFQLICFVFFCYFFVLFVVFFLLGFSPKLHPYPLSSTRDFMDSVIYSKDSYLQAVRQVNVQYTSYTPELRNTILKKWDYLNHLLVVFICLLILSVSLFISSAL